VAPGDKWLRGMWPRVRAQLPAPPARVIDLGCGRSGGFVPFLVAEGYDAVGIDPNAPEDERYHRTAFEDAELPEDVDAVIASTSLHHVRDPAHVIDRIRGVLVSGGTAVVVEWAWEDFDARAADWCFARLGPEDEPGWLRRRLDAWRESGHEWSDYFLGWAEREGLHRGDALVRLLDERLQRRHFARGPYFFADLAGTSEADEQAAIDANELRPARIDYVGIRE
jgi:SAM-dependent methyltransferase